MCISEKIFTECEQNGLMIDRSELPIKLGPDCYLVSAVPSSPQCTKHGYCKQGSYYALTGGSKIKIIPCDSWRSGTSPLDKGAQTPYNKEVNKGDTPHDQHITHIMALCESM